MHRRQTSSWSKGELFHFVGGAKWRIRLWTCGVRYAFLSLSLLLSLLTVFCRFLSVSRRKREHEVVVKRSRNVLVEQLSSPHMSCEPCGAHRVCGLMHRRLSEMYALPLSLIIVFVLTPPFQWPCFRRHQHCLRLSCCDEVALSFDFAKI